MKTSIIRKFSSGENVLAIMRKNGAAWFKGNEVASALGYADPKQTIKKKINADEKYIRKMPTNGYHKYELVTFISEPAVYELIFSSKLKVAKEFKKWVRHVVLPDLRKASLLNRNILFNETDLHYNVVKYIKLHYPKVILIPGLGEYQKTQYLRCDAWSKGYTGGQPDLMIPLLTKKYNGLAIELKTPKGIGVVSYNQSIWHQYLTNRGFLVIVGHIYKKIIKEIKKYLDEVSMSCQKCRKFYKNPKPLANHLLICDRK